ncbi:hypothetical protein FOD75_11350 (plasmid) [Limosilactobacillus reuteri]|uniref:Uncharacterized protein n=1 Tax=Limosilactobacillus reuteri TaxID=1598 RepID=A0A517D8J1_LIMRT|nr:hypothetical protein [Limosilactobacillus reuteri]QDR73680.1 hypothetical protein FOD75_11350 [Limosilactobacillus reuteri]
MFHQYAKFPGELEISFSDVIDDQKASGKKTVFVCFKQKVSDHVKRSRFTLPDKKLVYNEGFTAMEQEKNELILTNNEELIWKYAKLGGVKLK